MWYTDRQMDGCMGRQTDRHPDSQTRQTEKAIKVYEHYFVLCTKIIVVHRGKNMSFRKAYCREILVFGGKFCRGEEILPFMYIKWIVSCGKFGLPEFSFLRN